jgi:hypothetical protein
MGNEVVREKLKEIFEATVDSDSKYSGSFTDIDYYSLLCKSAAKDRLFKLMGNNMCMFNCKYDENDAVLMLFSIPVNTKEIGSKHISERVMEVIENVEACFTTTDFSSSRDVKEDKFVYMVVIKKLDKKGELNDYCKP